MKKIIIIGGYGNGTVAQSTIEDINKEKNKFEILGYLNDFEEQPINGIPIIGKVNKDTVDKFRIYNDVFFYYSLISIKFNYKFLTKLYSLELPLDKFPTLVHPTAVISNNAKIGFGCCINPFVSVGPNVVIGNHVQIYGQALIGHGASLGDFVYVANNACIGAEVSLFEGSYLGTNCSIREFVEVGKWSIVGMGSVVLNNIPDLTKFAGNPAKFIGQN